MMLFALTQKVIRDFGYFLMKICDQDFSKIAQSGHTGDHYNVDRCCSRTQSYKGFYSKFYIALISKQSSRLV